MADINEIHPENVPGRFYVDRSCILCDICTEIAPDNFKKSDKDGDFFVAKQPTDAAEEANCQEAFNSCPVECIGIRKD